MRTALLVTLLLACTEAAWARVGGGQSYGGGGDSGSGGGGGGGDFLVYLLIRLIFQYPAIGIPLAIAVGVGWMIMNAQSARGLQGNLSTAQQRDWSASVTPTRRRSLDLSPLQGADPNFSQPLFLDFVNLLYARLQTERTGDMAGLAGYLSPELRERIRAGTQQSGVTEVRDVVVGSLRITDGGLGADRQSLVVDLETNYTEVSPAGLHTWYSVERWTFGRKAGVLSKGPEEITKLACPSCGNPAEFRPDGSCPFCEKVVTDGSFAWVLQDVQVRSRTPKPPMDLRRGGAEVGTDLPTRMQPNFEQKRKEFMVRHPDFAWPEFEKRIRHTFEQLQAAWSQGKWELARPFETDHLFSTHRYWIDMYAREGLANRIEDVVIERVTPVKIETDAFFDAMTVRIWASAKDWTEEKATGRVVAGSRDRDRRFTEYWTFVRRSGFQGKGTEDNATCPSCGAPLQIGMSGVCPYCDTKITTGEFDWVLSRIEQDEAYEG